LSRALWFNSNAIEFLLVAQASPMSRGWRKRVVRIVCWIDPIASVCNRRRPRPSAQSWQEKRLSSAVPCTVANRLAHQRTPRSGAQIFLHTADARRVSLSLRLLRCDRGQMCSIVNERTSSYVKRLPVAANHDQHLGRNATSVPGLLRTQFGLAKHSGPAHFDGASDHHSSRNHPSKKTAPAANRMFIYSSL
jgi:hypothetical protein